MKTTQTWKIGDCLELLPEIPDKSIDMILTDLPYGTTACKWDTVIPFEPLWNQYKRIIKDNGAIVLTASQPFTSFLIMSNLELFKYNWYWVKEKGTGFANANKAPLRCVEDICVFGGNNLIYNPQKEPLKHKYIRKYKDTERSSNSNRITQHGDYIAERNSKYPTNILCFNRDSQNGLSKSHETQKPVILFEYLIKTYTKEGDTVHDSCLGSGTTLEACANLNRNCIGFEISHEWEEHYRKRLKLDNTKLDAWADRVLVGCE